MVCPAELLARPEAEPLPPEGVQQTAVFQALVAALGEDKALALWRWWQVEWPGWARENATARDKGWRFCTAALAPPAKVTAK